MSHNRETVQIHLTDLPANYDLYVYGASDNTKLGIVRGSSTNDDQADELVTLTNAPPNDYYVRVEGVDGAWDADHPYQLRFDTMSVASP